ncbi:MAG: hypothetical protein U9R27_02040 [Campylobacterota bacterium]|nr:hypothetical protein [Campylobacterota bacterium]
MDKMRQGVVLFITLSVIVAMMALVGVIFAYLEKSKDDASYTSSLIQADLLFRDTKDAISALLKKSGEDKETRRAVLDMLYLAPVTIQAEESDAYATIFCQPLDNGVNINWLGLENNSSTYGLYDTAQTIFDQLVDQYDIQNGSLLLSKILYAIDPENLPPSDHQSRLEQKKGIISLSQMHGIVREYRFEADDAAVESIPWESYFTFGMESDIIDGNYISAKLISLLFEMELPTVEEEWIEGESLKEFITDQGGDISRYNDKLFTEEIVERMRCLVNYGYQGRSYAFGFDYLEGRAEQFEFYGKQ